MKAEQTTFQLSIFSFQFSGGPWLCVPASRQVCPYRGRMLTCNWLFRLLGSIVLAEVREYRVSQRLASLTLTWRIGKPSNLRVKTVEASSFESAALAQLAQHLCGQPWFSIHVSGLWLFLK